MLFRSACCCAGLLLAGGYCLAQSSESAKPDWFMQGYHLAGPVPAEELRPVDPLVSQMQDIQNRTLTILRKAEFEEDLPTALVAAGQAAANVQAMAVLTGRLQAPPPPRSNGATPGATPNEMKAPAPVQKPEALTRLARQ